MPGLVPGIPREMYHADGRAEPGHKVLEV